MYTWKNFSNAVSLLPLHTPDVYAVSHSGNRLSNYVAEILRPFLCQMSCNLIDQLLFTTYLHPACLWKKNGKKELMVDTEEVIISQHNIIADGFG